MNILPLLDDWFEGHDAHSANTYNEWLEGTWAVEEVDDEDPEWNVWVGFFCIHDEEAFE